jgi:hypothetical protein
MNTKAGLGIVLAGLWAFACSEAPVDIGDENKTQRTGESLSDYAGSWSGYTEAFTFESAGDSDRIRLLIDEQGNGSLQVGEGAASVPTFDIDVPPAGPWSAFIDSFKVNSLVAGYRYTLKDLRVAERRLRFTVDPLELWRPWCQAQIPMDTDVLGRTYSPPFCHLNSYKDFESKTCMDLDSNGNAFPMDCGAHNLCMVHCVCTQNSCDASLLGNFNAPFGGGPEDVYEGDLSLDEEGNEIVGTLLVKADVERERPVQLRLKL